MSRLKALQAGKSKKANVTFRKVVRNLVEAGMSLADIGKLTLYQLHMLSCKEEDLGGTKKAKFEEL